MRRTLVWLVGAMAVASGATTSAQTQPASTDKINSMLNDQSVPQSTTLDAVVLSSNTGDVRLQPIPGTFSTTYAFLTVLMFLDYSDQHATARTTDVHPALHLKIGVSPKSRVYLVKTEVNPRTNNRSLKMGHSGFGSIGGMTAPDAKWSIPCTITQDGPGVWKLVPDVALEPGEYGVFSPTVAGGMQVPASGDLYDFGVDKAQMAPLSPAAH